MKRQVKTGIKAGGGPPPGFVWTVKFLSLVESDASDFLDKSQYEHVIDQVKALAMEKDPLRPQTVKVKPFDDFAELWEKGGPLGRLAVRVFFFVDGSSIVLLGAIRKQNDGSTPPATVTLMKRRKRKYLNGDYG